LIPAPIAPNERPPQVKIIDVPSVSAGKEMKRSKSGSGRRAQKCAGKSGRHSFLTA